MRRLMVTTSSPAAIRAETWLWRSAWNETRGRFKDSTGRRQSQLRLSGECGDASAREHQIIAIGAAKADREPVFHLSLAVSPQHLDRARR